MAKIPGCRTYSLGVMRRRRQANQSGSCAHVSHIPDPIKRYSNHGRQSKETANYVTSYAKPLQFERVLTKRIAVHSYLTAVTLSRCPSSDLSTPRVSKSHTVVQPSALPAAMNLPVELKRAQLAKSSRVAVTDSGSS